GGGGAGGTSGSGGTSGTGGQGGIDASVDAPAIDAPAVDAAVDAFAIDAAVDAPAIDAPIDGSPTDAATATVTGTRVFTFVTDTGDVQQPQDLSTATIAALVPNGSGGFVTYPGSGTASGAFSIPNVPVGTYYLRNDTTFLVTSARVIDLG